MGFNVMDLSKHEKVQDYFGKERREPNETQPELHHNKLQLSSGQHYLSFAAVYSGNHSLTLREWHTSILFSFLFTQIALVFYKLSIKFKRVYNASLNNLSTQFLIKKSKYFFFNLTTFSFVIPGKTSEDSLERN